MEGEHYECLHWKAWRSTAEIYGVKRRNSEMISCKWTDWDREEEPAVPRCVLRTQGWVHPSVSAFDGGKNCRWKEVVGGFLWVISCAQCWCSCGFWAMISVLYHGKKTENCSSVWSRWQQMLDFYTVHVSCNDFLWVLNLIFTGQVLILPSEARGTAREAEMPCVAWAVCSASQVLGWGSIPDPGWTQKSPQWPKSTSWTHQLFVICPTSHPGNRKKPLLPYQRIRCAKAHIPYVPLCCHS